MRIAGVEIRRLTPEERERIPQGAGVVFVLILIVLAVTIGLDWWLENVVAFATGLVMAFWLLWYVQRDGS